MINQIQAKFYYEMGWYADDHNQFHELPEIAEHLVKAFDIELEIPERFLWGRWGMWNSKIRKVLKNKYGFLFL